MYLQSGSLFLSADLTRANPLSRQRMASFLTSPISLCLKAAESTFRLRGNVFLSNKSSHKDNGSAGRNEFGSKLQIWSTWYNTDVIFILTNSLIYLISNLCLPSEAQGRPMVKISSIGLLRAPH